MRAIVKRRIKNSIDDYGQPTVPVDGEGQIYTLIGVAVPCRIYYDTLTRSREHIDIQPAIEYEVNRMIGEFSSLEDIQVMDFVESVTDRLGNKVFDQMEITAVMPRKTYLQVLLKERK